MNLMKCHGQKWMLAILLLAGLAISAFAAGGNIAESRLANEGHRFLLVVETSKTMQRYGEAAVNAIHELLESGMQKQLRPGDSIGVWTYNDQLYAGKFPSQEWNPTDSKAIHDRILKFIVQQKCEKTGSWQKALPTIARVVKDSQLITVILVSDGEEDISGTPYDEEINAFYRTWRDKQRKALKPFVTVFRGENGKLTHYTICPVPWPIEIPALPADRDSLHLDQTKSGTTKAASPRIGKPLIVSGPPRKYEPTETPATASVSATPQATAPSAAAASTPSASSTVLPQPTAATLALATAPAPAAAKPAAQLLPQPTAQPIVKDARQEVADLIISNLLAEADQPQTPAGSAKLTVTGAATSGTLPASTANHLIIPVAVVTPDPTTVAAAPTVASNVMPVRASEPVTLAKSQPVPEKPEPTPGKTVARVSTASVPVSIPQSSAQPPAPAGEGFFASKGTQNAALALAVGALGCLFIAVRRPKSSYRPSIITRSLERESR